MKNTPELNNFDNGFTLALWFKSDTTSGPRIFISKWNDATGEHSYIFKDHNSNDKIRLELYSLLDMSSVNSIVTG